MELLPFKSVNTSSVENDDLDLPGDLQVKSTSKQITWLDCEFIHYITINIIINVIIDYYIVNIY